MAERYAEEIARISTRIAGQGNGQRRARSRDPLPTAGMYATAFTHMDPRSPPRYAGPTNNWLYDYIPGG